VTATVPQIAKDTLLEMGLPAAAKFAKFLPTQPMRQVSL